MPRKTAPRRGRKRATPSKTESESRFETYLSGLGVGFEYEPQIGNKKKRPDYWVRWNEHLLVAEVKELHARRPDLHASSSFDPYGGIRKEIHEVRKQFREFKDHCCILVLYNVDDWEFRDWPYIVFGAMLGDAGIRIPFDPNRGRLSAKGARAAFLGSGKMVVPKSRVPENTTISAIAVLGDVTIPNPEFQREYERRVALRSADGEGDLPIAESLGIRIDLYEELRPTLGEALQLKVFENPLARRPLPTDVFDGDYDSRYAFNLRSGKIERVAAGQGLLEAERVTEGEADISSKIDRFTLALVERFEPERVVLFGSYAYGRPDPGSDVDLLVIFPGDGSAADRSLDIRKRLHPGFPLDLLARSAGEVERRMMMGDPFMREIIEKGKTLYPRTGAA